MRYQLILSVLVLVLGVEWLVECTLQVPCEAQQVSLPYPSINTVGGYDDRRIIGGHLVALREYPFFASLIGLYSRWPFCGGSLLNDRYVLTAGHCVERRTADRLRVLLGAVHVPDQGVIYRVDQIIMHPNYVHYRKPFRLIADFALLSLRKQVKFTSSIRPVSLPPRRLMLVNQDVEMTGFGLVKDDGNAPPYQYKTEGNILSYRLCELSTAQQQLHASKLCVTSKFTANNTDRGICNGDSGGPLILRGDSGKMMVIGVASYVYKPCGMLSWPDVFGNVIYALQFIRDYVE